ncbi:MAG: T9SS type A sorting domain-containing protein [Saprospiraceae bacterium]
MQNPINCGRSRACYTPTYRFATIFAFFFLFCFGNLQAQSEIGLAKSILGVDLPQSHTPGNFNVIFELNLQNTGTTSLEDLQIVDQLDAVNQYGTAFQRIVDAPTIVQSDATTLPSLNTSFSGRSGQANLFTSGGQLEPGESIRIQFTVEVDPDASGANATLTNQAMAIANDGTATVSDLSDSGTDPNSTNSDALGDNGTSDDPTPLTDCYSRMNTLACNDVLNPAINDDCTTSLNADNLIEGDISDCDDATYPLGGYYQLQMKTLDGLTIDDLDPSTPNSVEFDAEPYDAVMANLTNIVTGNSCWVRIDIQDKLAPSCAAQNDVEALINLDGIDQGRDGDFIDDVDPSGIDDLQDEYILCRFVEQYTVDPYFDDLEEEDFVDCSEIENIDNNTLFTEVCSAADLAPFTVDNSRFDQTRYTISGVYERTWSVRDVNGFVNTSSCTQRVFVLRPLRDLIEINPLPDPISCTANLDRAIDAANPRFLVRSGDRDIINGGRGTGSTDTRGRRYALGEGFSCGYIVRLTEGNTVDLCGGSVKQFRTFSVIERCSQEQIFRNVQQILKIEDQTPPEFTAVPDFIIGTDKFTCTADGNILAASITDDCSLAQVDRVTIERLFPQSSNSANNFIGSVENGGSVSDLPMGMGTYSLIYYASDDCGNVSRDTSILTVEDQTPPVVICDDELHLSLISDNEGSQFARLRTDALNETSYDNCFPVIFRVRSTNNANQSDNEFGQFAEFSCADLSNPDLMAEMLVIEDRDGDGVYPDDDGGLISSCMARIHLEDKAAPTMICEDLTVSCNDASLSALLDPTRTDFRAPAFAEGCPGVGNTTLSLRILDANFSGDCEAGTFIRRFTATRQLNGFSRTATCDQLVNVEYVSDWDITFPRDYVINCGSNEEVPPAPAVDELLKNFGCDSWGVEVEEDVFDVVTGGGCQKIIRTYKFINWCTWSPNEASEPARVNRPIEMILDNAERVSLRHFSKDFGINELDDQGDRDPYDEEQDFAGRKDNDGALVILNSLVGGTRYDVFGFTDEEEVNDREDIYRVDANNYGHFTYTQIIKVVDDTAPVIAPIRDITVTDRDGDCVASIILPVPVITDCQPTYTVTYNAGILGSGIFSGTAPRLEPVTLPNAPIDAVYPITYTVADGCGNTSRMSFNVSTVDGTPPTATCIPGLSLDLDANGEAEIWASDFDYNSFDGCNDVTVSFANLQGTADPATFMADCSMRGSNAIQLLVTDAAGNSSICNTILNIQSDNPQQECGGGSAIRIAGNISTENGDEVEGVAVHLAGELDGMHYTDVSGMYQFDDIPDGSEVRLQPERNDNPLNGVSTHDLVLISKHILGVQHLDSPYKMIAADVNRSRTITTFDLVQLRKLILGIDTEFTDNQSWCFIDKKHEFTDASNPWAEAFPELLTMDEVHNSMTADFVAIKTGDVNGSAIPNQLVQIGERSVSTLPIDITVKREGNIQILSFHSSVVNRMEGMQMELEFNTQKVDFQSVEYGIFRSQHINTMHADNGKLTFSWNVDSEVRDTDIPLFQLEFKVDNKINWSNILSIDESRIAAEAYVYDLAGDLGFYGLRLRNRSVAEEAVVLYQNAPNPFIGRTVIPFELPTAQRATVKIYSTTGVVVFEQSDNFSAGHNQVEVDWNGKAQTGLLYYTLETPTQSVTKKMLVLE